MAKRPCAICGKYVGSLSSKVQINDGVVCLECIGRYGLYPFQNANKFDCESVKGLAKRREYLNPAFRITNAVCYFFQVDEISKSIRVNNVVFSYDDIDSYELIQNHNSVTKGGVGRAIAGGLLFGAAGAIVGGVTAPRSTEHTCYNMYIRIFLKNTIMDSIDISFISSAVKTNTQLYNVVCENVKKCIKILKSICYKNTESPKLQAPQTVQATQTTQATQTAQNNTYIQTQSVADEILKFKNLLDQGVISQEEFDIQKKKLLG